MCGTKDDGEEGMWEQGCGREFQGATTNEINLKRRGLLEWEMTGKASNVLRWSARTGKVGETSSVATLWQVPVRDQDIGDGGK